MARITLEMLRRRAEHNDGLLLSLEEVALHRQGLERLEGLQEACPRLKIALLQDNLIPRIGARRVEARISCARSDRWLTNG